VGINLGEPQDRVARYAAEMGLSFPIVIDAGGAVSREYGVHFTPTHVLIDRTGVVRAAGAGAQDWTGVAARAAIDALMLAPSPRAAGAGARGDRAISPPIRRPEGR